MKFWKVEKGSGFNATYYLCGYPVYKVIDKLNLRERIFCKGLVSSKKVTDHYNGLRLKDCFICGQRVLQYGSCDYRYIIKLLGLTLYNKEISTLFYNKYKSKIPKDTDYLCFLATGIGEFSLFLSLCLKNFMKQNNIKHPLFITKAKHNIALLNIFFPTAKILYIQGFPFQRVGEFNINNIRARYFFPIPYFQQVEEDITNKKAHFFDSILNYLNLEPNNFDVNLPKISEELNKKINLYNSTDKTILFIPEANSTSAGDLKYWDKLASLLKKAGYSVISNVICKEHYLKNASLNENFRTEDLISLGFCCKAVISIRNGMCDILNSRGKDLFVFGTSRTTSKSKKFFSLNEMYNRNDINEYSDEKAISPEDLIKKILEN